MTTKVLQSPDPDTSVEARSLTHVNAHPQMASILRKLFAMRERLAAVDTDIRAQRQENSVLEAQEVIAVAELGAGWQPSPQLQTGRQRLTGLLDEQRMIQEALPYAHQQTEEVRTSVQQALRPEVEGHVRPVLERYVDALEEILTLQQELEDAARWSGNLLGVSTVPDMLRDQALIGRLRYLHDTLRSKYTF